MSDVEVLPEIKEIVGAILFAAKQPVTVERMVEVLRQTAEQGGGPGRELGGASEEDVRPALETLTRELSEHGTGMRIVAVAGGWRLENDTRCGPWLRQFLEKGKPNRLSQPALETLAIIAYRQPVIRSEIESVRGVAVDQIVRNLLDLQLIRAVGRSDLPGRPWLFGTTQRFLEHFGLRSLDELPGMDELRRMEARRQSEQDAQAAAQTEADPAPDEPAAETDPAGADAEETPDEPGEEEEVRHES